jgi:hypothetical protein
MKKITKFDKQIKKLLIAYHKVFDWQGNRKKNYARKKHNC